MRVEMSTSKTPSMFEGKKIKELPTGTIVRANDGKYYYIVVRAPSGHLQYNTALGSDPILCCLNDSESGKVYSGGDSVIGPSQYQYSVVDAVLQVRQVGI